MPNFSLKTLYVLIISYSLTSYAQDINVFKDTAYEVCFTPGENCTQLIVNKIDKAKQSIFVQAYSFTSAPIALALVNAKKEKLLLM